jgi:exoribonuclease R
MIDWPVNSKYGRVKLIGIEGKIGDLNIEVDLMLKANNILTKDFSYGSYQYMEKEFQLN